MPSKSRRCLPAVDAGHLWRGYLNHMKDSERHNHRPSTTSSPAMSASVNGLVGITYQADSPCPNILPRKKMSDSDFGYICGSCRM